MIPGGGDSAELARAESERDVQEIRQELVEGGYVRDSQGKKRMKQIGSVNVPKDAFLEVLKNG